jgi:hypothetical protein
MFQLTTQGRGALVIGDISDRHPRGDDAYEFEIPLGVTHATLLLDDPAASLVVSSGP